MTITAHGLGMLLTVVAASVLSPETLAQANLTVNPRPALPQPPLQLNVSGVTIKRDKVEIAVDMFAKSTTTEINSGKVQSNKSEQDEVIARLSERVSSLGRLESLCGPRDDTIDVENYIGNSPFPEQDIQLFHVATVNLRWVVEPVILRAHPGFDAGNVAGYRWCSGSLIGEDTVLTAGHCFDASYDEGGWITPFRRDGNEIRQLSPSEHAVLFAVDFNYQYQKGTRVLRRTTTFPVVKLLEHRLGGLDFALVRLGRNAGKMPNELFAPRVVAQSPVEPDQEITIIQHPRGNPKRIGFGSLLTDSETAREPVLKYGNVDTFGGSSGAGVLNKRGNLIGVHTNGGCEFDANRAVSIDGIRRHSQLLK